MILHSSSTALCSVLALRLFFRACQHTRQKTNETPHTKNAATPTPSLWLTFIPTSIFACLALAAIVAGLCDVVLAICTRCSWASVGQ